MKRSVVIKRLDYEASAGWTTYGTLLAAFSLFLGWEALMPRTALNQVARHWDTVQYRAREQAAV
jgi:hypothetical protein